MNGWLIVAICFWMTTLFRDIYFVFIFLLCLLYLFYRLKEKRWMSLYVIFVFLFALITLYQKPAHPGQYTVYEIKQNYALARQGRQKLVLYDVEDLSYYDRVEVEKIETLHSLDNLSLFSFEEHMAKKGIFSFASQYSKISSSNHFKAKLFRRFKEKDDPFLMSALYQIHQKNSFFASLGVPLLVLFTSLERKMRKWWTGTYSHPLIILLMIMYSFFFPFHPSLVRLILLHIAMYRYENWKAHQSAVLIGYPLCVSGGSLDLALLVPVSFLWISKKGWNKKQEACARFFLLLIFQILFFSKIDLLSLFFFLWFKKMYALLFLMKLLPFSWSWLHVLEGLEAWEVLSFSVRPTLFFTGICVFLFWFLVTDHRFHSFMKTGVLCLGILALTLFCDPFFHVYMLDIGQGDCTLIVEPFQKSVIMIDAGQNMHRDNVEEIIVPFLRSRNIRKIDALIATHDDFDHSGGIEQLCESFPVEKVIRDPYERVDVEYPFLSLLPEREAKDENDQSLIHYFAYDGLEYLWTGDAGIEIEQQLLDQYELGGVDVLKLGHHGSATSSSFDFLMKTDPLLALISVGKNNRYGHPHPDVLASLRELGIDALMTKDDGMIHIFTLKSLRFFETAKGRIGMFDQS